MPRTKGSRDLAYEARRHELVQKARERLIASGSGQASLRDLAGFAEVSLPTLRHYFPKRDDLIVAILQDTLNLDEPHLARMANPDLPFVASVREALGGCAAGFAHGLGDIHSIGLTEGLRHDRLGPAFVDIVLEPALQSIQHRLDTHVTREEMSDVDTRHAALVLLAPVVFAFLHQEELRGKASHPLVMDEFLDDHAKFFVRAFAAPSTLDVARQPVAPIEDETAGSCFPTDRQC